MAFRGRFRSFDFWGGVLTGALVVAFLVLVAYFYLPIAPEYSDLITNVGTVAAALIGSLFVYFTARYQMNRQREQDLASARAMLPLVLTAFADRCRFAAVFFVDWQLHKGEYWDAMTSFSKIESGDLGVIRDNVRSSDGIEREWLSLLISIYSYAQFHTNEFAARHKPSDHKSRELIVMKRILSGRKPAALLFEWLVIWALADMLLDHAVGSKAEIPSCIDLKNIRRLLDEEEIGNSLTFEDEETIEYKLKQLGCGSISEVRKVFFSVRSRSARSTS